jgi:hypothetical protein
MQLHLFSSADPERALEWVVETCTTCLNGKQGATIAYLPLGSLFTERSLARIEKAFAGVARIEPINTETMELSVMEAIVRRAALAYSPEATRTS